MKRIITLALALMLVFALAACGNNTDPAPSDSTDPGASQQESSTDTASSQQESSDTSEESTPEASTPEATPGEVTDFDLGISSIPAEWQKCIGQSMYGMNTGAGDDYSDSYVNKFGSVSAEDYAKLIAYFDTLSYTEKLDGVYNCDWGQLQIAHNADASEMTISWYAN